MSDLPPATLPAYRGPPPPPPRPAPPGPRSLSPPGMLLVLGAGLAAWLLLPSPLGLALLGASLVAADAGRVDAPALGYLGFLLVIVASWGALVGVGVALVVVLGLLAAPLLLLALLEVVELLAEGARLARRRDGWVLA